MRLKRPQRPLAANTRYFWRVVSASPEGRGENLLHQVKSVASNRGSGKSAARTAQTRGDLRSRRCDI